jgi:hypothetical protein
LIQIFNGTDNEGYGIDLLYRLLVWYFFRHEDRYECIQEMKEMEDMGTTFYKESGNLFKLAGVLRAADIFWNVEKRYGRYNIYLASYLCFKLLHNMPCIGFALYL